MTYSQWGNSGAPADWCQKGVPRSGVSGPRQNVKNGPDLSGLFHDFDCFGKTVKNSDNQCFLCFSQFINNPGLGINPGTPVVFGK